MQRRRLAGQILERLGVTAAGLATLTQRQLAAMLEDLKQPEHSLRQALRSKVSGFAERLKEDAGLQARFEEWKNGVIAGRSDLDRRISAFVKAGLAATTAESGKVLIHKWIGSQVDKLIADFKQDAGQQQELGHIVRQALLQLIDTHHAQIGTIVRERLGQLSNQALVAFIEERVGNDLQMIRINGSVVGGLAGMVIFLLTSWW
jgi:uncharacterized membrane-anchored protein YjiN (DUF445 family)